ncbi:MAG: hypothetical protein ACI9R3_005245 [Verrucomicrobiales bacterium]|jgi:hypothetical protein
MLDSFRSLSVLSVGLCMALTQLSATAEQVVISEVHYHPTGDLPEFIEVTNITATPFDIAQWKLRDGVDYDFPAFSSASPQTSFLHAFERIVIASVDAATFRQAYGLPPTVPVFGPWEGTLNNAGERITLKNKNGVSMATVDYNDRGLWPVAADGTGHSLVLKDVDEGNDNWRNWTISAAPGGSPGLPEVTQAEESIRSPEVNLATGIPFVQFGDQWKYHDKNQNLGTAWRAVDYNDASWDSGSGLFGFESSSLPAPGIRTPLQNSDNEDNHITYYFRTEFTFNGDVAGASFTIDQIVDDGAFYYLNGQPIGGVGVAANSGWKDTANRTVGDASIELNVVSGGSAALRQGRNVLAAEVHQTNSSSSDCVFAAQFNIAVPAESGALINEVLAVAGADGFIEFYNPQNSAVDLNGFSLSDDPSNLQKYPIDQPLTIPAGGFATLNFAAAGFSQADPLVVYLSDSAGSVVSAIDAAIPLDGRSVGRKPAGGGEWYLFTEATPGTPNASSDGSNSPLRINEVHFDVDGNIDWVEFINAGGMDASLTDLRLATLPDLADAAALSGSLVPGAVIQVQTTFDTAGQAESTLFLASSSGRILQADLFKFRAQAPSYQAFPDGGREWYRTATSTPGVTNAPARETNIVINEIMCDPPSNSRNGEFVELYNRGDSTVDLADWEFVEGIRFQFPAGTTLAAGGYLVVAADASNIEANNVIGGASGRLRNGGELLRMEDAAGNLADQVDYRTGGEWSDLANGNGSSLELIHPDMDNDFSSAWRPSDESNKSTFQEFTVSGIYQQSRTEGGTSDYKELHLHLVGDAHVILKEITLQRNGSGSNILQNSTRRSTNGSGSTGWLCQGTHYRSGFEGDEFHLISDGHGDNRANRAEIDATAMNRNSNYKLTFQARWVSGKPRLIAQTWDHSIGNALLLPIPRNLGTPGAANSQQEALPAPQVTSIRHAPAVPAASDPVRIIADITSAVPIADVQVVHRADSSNGNGAWRTTAMNDDGTDGDDLAGDGIYTTTLTDYQNDGRIAQFYVVAAGENGASSQLPGQGRNRPAMWVVDNSTINSDLRTLRFVVSDYDRSALGGTGETATFDYNFPRLSNHYYNMTFISNEQKIIYGAEVRKSGSPWTRSGGSGLSRGKWKVPGDRPFRGRIKSSFDDDAANGDRRYNNRLPRHWLYLLGHPINENEYVQLIINDDSPDLREDIEPVANDFLDRNFTDGTDGELYRIDDEWWFEDDWNRGQRNADWGYKGTHNPVRYHTEWMKRSRETDYDFSSLTSMMQMVSTNRFSEAESTRIFDHDLMAINAAVRGYSGDWDTFTLNRGKNGYFYRKSTDGRFMLLHWDSDLAFQNTNETFLGNLSGVRNYFGKPYVERLYNHYLNRLVNEFTQDSSRMDAWFDAEEASSNAFTVNTGKYQNWFSGRASRANSEIGSDRSVAFNITTGNGSSGSTSQPTYTLTGPAPSSVYTVRVVDHPEAEVVFTNTRTWRASGIQLISGSNQLVVQGVDSDGNVVETMTFTVNKTGTTAPVVTMQTNPKSLNIAVSERINLDASRSYDANAAEGVLTFNWQATPAADSTIANAAAALTSATFSRPGLYTVSVSAESDSGGTASIESEVSVHAKGDFATFSDSILDPMFTAQRVDSRASNPVGHWYSLETRTDNLVIQVTGETIFPLTTTNPAFPAIQRPLPSTGDWVLQTDLSLQTVQLGSFLTGLIIETTAGDQPVNYAFGLDDGDALAIRKSTNGGAYVSIGTSNFSSGTVTLRIRKTSTMLHFEYRNSAAEDWIEVDTAAVTDGSTVQTGGIFAATDVALPLQVAFDYLMVVDPGKVSAAQRFLRITEIMYHPTQGDAYEFIELTNIGTEPLSLRGIATGAGRPFTAMMLGESTLAPGAQTVLVSDTAAMRLAYGDNLSIAGEWPGGKLSNDGEAIEIFDDQGQPILDFRYNDGSDWPQEADGQGKSLEVVDTSGSYDAPKNWRASSVIGGTPTGLTLLNPQDPDTDGDGLTDTQEIALGTNPAIADTDGDGYDDGLEIALGIDPLSRASTFQVLSTINSADSITLSWPSSSGGRYIVETSAVLGNNEAWQEMETITGFAGETSASVSIPRSMDQSMYYRIRFDGK